MIGSKNYISEFTVGKNNNFDFIRFLAAALVIWGHSFTIGKSNHPDYLEILTNGQMRLGILGVAIFFIISGFLITQSFDRSRDVKKFFKARVLRIFPGLAVALLVTVFVIGPLATTTPLGQYFSNSETYKHLLIIFLKPLQYNILPGVFNGETVNGSLWTLQYEFEFYVVVALLGLIGFLNKKTVFPLFLFVLVVGTLPIPVGSTFVDMFRYFAAGMFFYIFKDKITLNKFYLTISLVGIIVLAQIGGFQEVFPIFGGYLIFFMAYSQKIKLSSFGKYGDFSYGLYIYSYPIQQFVTHQFGGSVHWLTNFLISFPISLVLAALSWHLVEKRVLKLKLNNGRKVEREVKTQAV